jgi:hypothetical protein
MENANLSRIISLALAALVAIVAIAFLISPYGNKTAPKQYPTRFPGIYWKIP